MKKSIRISVFCFLLMCMTANSAYSQSDTEPGFIFAPIIGRLAGIGAFYGALVGMENIGSSTIDVLGGKTTGRVEATGLLLNELTLSKDNISLAAGFAQVDKLHLDISYTRGMEDDDPVTQVGSAQGAALIFNWDIFKPALRFSSTLAQWDYKFDEYLTHEDEEKIELPDVYLGDLKSTFIINNLVLDVTDSPENPRSGFLLGLNLNSLTTNTEFSGTNTASYFLNAYLPIREHSTWVFRVFGSDTAVSSEKITDVDKIKSLMRVDCTQVADTAKKAECEDLTDDIANYLAAHNKYGTATPMGGNKMLRSYREGRFRGAHTRMYGSELRFNFPSDGFISNYQTALFYERGTATDDTNELEKNYKSSYGFAVRVNLDQLMVRLESANGEEGSEWFLTIGNPW